MTQVATFPSSGGDRMYAVLLRDDGRLSCDCPGWTVKRAGKPRACKHTNLVAPKYQSVTQRDDGQYIGASAPTRLDLVDEVNFGGVAPAISRTNVIPFPKPVGLAPDYLPLMLAGRDSVLDDAMLSADPARISAAWAKYTNDQWACEQKFDGERCLVAIRSGVAVAWSRAGGGRNTGLARDLDPRILRDLATFPDCDLDGEVVLGAGKANVKGKEALQVASLVIFDVLAREGADLRAQPYTFRRAALAEIAGNIPVPTPSITFAAEVTPSFAIYQAIIEGGGEGVMLKRRASRYVGRRSDDWMKVKARAEATVVIVGFEDSNINDGKNAVINFRMASGVESKCKTKNEDWRRRITAGTIKVGAKMEIEYATLMPSGKPRHPMAKRIAGEA